MPGDVLEVEVTAKAYAPGRDVLRDIRFAARSGEIIALLGPSGIGKSTLLRILLRLDKNYTGAVRGPPEPVGAIFQEPRLLPWLSVADNLRLVGVGNSAALLQRVGLPDAAKLMPDTLSLGMARRVAMARALAVDPRTVIADEPFASLDRNLAMDIGALLVEHARNTDALVIFSTHDLDLALALGTRLLLLSGAPARLALDRPLSESQSRVSLRQHLTQEFAFLAGAGDIQP